MARLAEGSLSQRAAAEALGLTRAGLDARCWSTSTTTGQPMDLLFARTESTFDYFASTERYLRRHGKPIAFYVNRKEAVGGVGYTQFGRAMQDLNIDVICANTAAAKGHVERAHQTLQDRLVKELRLNGINDREAGNAFIDFFREDYNRRFAQRQEASQRTS